MYTFLAKAAISHIAIGRLVLPQN